LQARLRSRIGLSRRRISFQRTGFPAAGRIEARFGPMRRHHTALARDLHAYLCWRGTGDGPETQRIMRISRMPSSTWAVPSATKPCLR